LKPPALQLNGLSRERLPRCEIFGPGGKKVALTAPGGEDWLTDVRR
jgi:hypothetical protein